MLPSVAFCIAAVILAVAAGPGVADVVARTAVDVVAVLGAARLLTSEASGRQRARIMNKAPGLTLVGLGLYVAATERGP